MCSFALSLFRSSYQDLLMCSGTVFNQIIIWKPSEEAESGKGVLKRLNGHDGVIFDICFNYEKQASLVVWGKNSVKSTLENQIKSSLYLR